jgi:sulfate adenylyltransferase
MRDASSLAVAPSLDVELVAEWDFSVGARIPTLAIDRPTYDDVICLATGVYAPLSGFQEQSAVLSVLHHWRLPNGSVWPIPITLAISADRVGDLIRRPLVRLAWAGRSVALMQLRQWYHLDPVSEARAVFGTLDVRHPGVRYYLRRSPIRAAGPVWLTRAPEYPVQPVATPAALRQMLTSRGWSRVAAFQTRNPLHRGHEYVQKVVLEWVDGLVLHPLVGTTQASDVPLAKRWRSYQRLLADYFPSTRVLLSGFPAPMRYAGPREAVLHAVTRKNYGITHLIVGRDHAGVGQFYPPDASQRAFDRFDRSELGIHVIFFPSAFYCRRCQQMATSNTCPHPSTEHIPISGTQIRHRLNAGESLPPEWMRPEVASLLRDPPSS